MIKLTPVGSSHLNHASQSVLAFLTVAGRTTVLTKSDTLGANLPDQSTHVEISDTGVPWKYYLSTYGYGPDATVDVAMQATTGVEIPRSNSNQHPRMSTKPAFEKPKLASEQTKPSFNVGAQTCHQEPKPDSEQPT